MKEDMNLQFIRRKINNLRTAIMYRISNFPDSARSLVTAVRVDDEGHLWFHSKFPVQPDLAGNENSFPVRLCFYRKGVDYYMEVSGKATIITHHPSLSEPTTQTTPAGESGILIRMTMTNIEYTEPHTHNHRSWLETWLGKTYKWLTGTIARESIHTAPHISKLRHTNYQ